MTAFGTTQSHVAATLSVPMFTSGIGSLMWGPICDAVGRRPTFLASALILAGVTAGCAAAPTITALIICRAFEGVACAGLLVATNAVLADVFEPLERGKWMGIASVPALLAPIVGPPLGGALALKLGWRSTFITAGIFCGVLLLAGLLILKVGGNGGRGGERDAAGLAGFLLLWRLAAAERFTPMNSLLVEL